MPFPKRGLSRLEERVGWRCGRLAGGAGAPPKRAVRSALPRARASVPFCGSGGSGAGGRRSGVGVGVTRGESLGLRRLNEDDAGERSFAGSWGRSGPSAGSRLCRGRCQRRVLSGRQRSRECVGERLVRVLVVAGGGTRTNRGHRELPPRHRQLERVGFVHAWRVYRL